MVEVTVFTTLYMEVMLLHLSWLHSTPTHGSPPASRLLTLPNTLACLAALLQIHWADSKLWALTGRLILVSPSGAGGVVMILGLSTLNNPVDMVVSVVVLVVLVVDQF